MAATTTTRSRTSTCRSPFPDALQEFSVETNALPPAMACIRRRGEYRDQVGHQPVARDLFESCATAASTRATIPGHARRAPSQPVRAAPSAAASSKTKSSSSAATRGRGQVQGVPQSQIVLPTPAALTATSALRQRQATRRSQDRNAVPGGTRFQSPGSIRRRSRSQVSARGQRPHRNLHLQHSAHGQRRSGDRPHRLLAERQDTLFAATSWTTTPTLPCGTRTISWSPPPPATWSALNPSPWATATR